MNRPAQSVRQRIYGHVNYFGLRTVASIVQGLGLDEHVVRQCLVELQRAVYVTAKEADGTTFYEVVPGKRYDDAYIDIQLAKQRESNAQHKAEQAESAEPEQSPPAATPHASLAAGPHMPAARRRRSYSPTTHAGSRKADNECKSPSHQRIVRAIRQHGRPTRHELITITGLPSGTVQARCRELIDKGYVIETGEERPSPHGVDSGVLAMNPDKPYPFC